MEEAQRCNKIAFLNAGEIVAEGTPSEVENSLDAFSIYKLTQKFDFALIAHLKKENSVHLVNQFGSELRIMVQKEFTSSQLSKVVEPFLDASPDLELTQPNLEDVFIALTQGDLL